MLGTVEIRQYYLRHWKGNMEQPQKISTQDGSFKPRLFAE